MVKLDMPYLWAAKGRHGLYWFYRRSGQRIPISSPDGRRLAYIGEREGAPRLYLRAIEQLNPIEVPGSDGAMNPFFSPDGNSVGFMVSANAIRTASVDGTPALTVVDSGVGITAVRSRCPAVGIPDYTGDVTLFRAGGDRTAAGIDVVAAMTNVRSQCNEESGDKVFANVSFDVLARRSDASGSGSPFCLAPSCLPSPTGRGVGGEGERKSHAR